MLRIFRGSQVAWVSFCITALCFASFSLLAQSDVGSITGFVHDPSGAVVPNATVKVKDEATGAERQVTTNQDGLFNVTNMPPSYYTISAEASGFKRFESTHNKLDPNATARIDATLAVGQASETIEVVGSAQTLQTDSATVQKLITRTQIDALELNGRNPIFLAHLHAGCPPRFSAFRISILAWTAADSISMELVQPGQPHHVRWRACCSYSFEWHQHRRGRCGFHSGNPGFDGAITRLNIAAPPAARSASSRRAARRSSTATCSSISATTF